MSLKLWEVSGFLFFGRRPDHATGHPARTALKKFSALWYSLNLYAASLTPWLRSHGRNLTLCVHFSEKQKNLAIPLFNPEEKVFPAGR
jgi:hypothetical protein